MDQPFAKLGIDVLLIVCLSVMGRWVWLLLKRRAMRLTDRPVPLRWHLVGLGIVTTLLIVTPPILNNSAASLIPDWRMRYRLNDAFQFVEVIIQLLCMAYFGARVHFRRLHLGQPTSFADPVRFTLPGVLYIVGLLGLLCWLLTLPILIMDPITSKGFIVDVVVMIGVALGVCGAYVILGILLARLGVDLGSMGGRPRQAATPPAVAGPLDKE